VIALQLSDEQFQQLVHAVADELERRHPSPTASSPFVDVQEAAEILCAKKQRVYDLVHQGALERCGDGRRLLLRRADVIAYGGGAA
jgi:excisionase family DNA binding protein